MTRGRFWTEAEIALLRELYPHHTTAFCADQVGHPIGSTHLKAFALGLKKTRAFYTRPAAIETLREHGVPLPKGRPSANALHHLSPELRETAQLLGKLKRTIREKQDRGPAQPPVRDARSAEGHR